MQDSVRKNVYGTPHSFDDVFDYANGQIAFPDFALIIHLFVH
jgi:hypothetical protein